MTHIVHGLAFELDWHTALSDDKKELKVLNSNRGNVYAEVSYDTSRKYGFAEVKKYEGVHSAAAGLADVFPDGVIFIHNIGPDLACCIVIAHHLPISGMDRVGSRTEMLECATDFLTKRTPEDVPMPVYGDLTPDEFPTAQPYSLNQLFEDGQGRGALKPVTSYNQKMIGIGIAILALALTWFGADAWDAMQPKKEAPPPDPKVIHHQTVTAAINDVVEKNKFPVDVLAGFIPFAENLAATAPGWEFEQLYCIDTKCTATWKRNSGGTSQSILEALSIANNDSTVSFNDIDHMTRELSFEKTTTAKKLLLVPIATFSKLVITLLQERKDKGYHPNTSTMNPLVPPPAGVNIPLEDNPKVGDYVLEVPFREVYEVAKLPDLMTIDTIEVRTRGAREGQGRKEIVVTFKGKYYAL
jgi:hypothetical protein